MLIVAIVSMLIAVTAYTIAVFTERKAGIILKKHIIIFLIGLFFDVLGTTFMSLISETFKMDIHGITGLAAVILMMIHVVLAILVYLKGTEAQKKNFHHYSLIIWMIWLIPFVTGLIINMA